jgi:hypothetical protein
MKCVGDGRVPFAGPAASAAAQPLVDKRRWREVDVIRIQVRTGRDDLVDLVENVVAELDIGSGQQIAQLLRGTWPPKILCFIRPPPRFAVVVGNPGTQLNTEVAPAPA